MSNNNHGVREPLFHISRRQDYSLWLAVFVRLAAILLALVVCGVVIVALTGLNPMEVYAGIIDRANDQFTTALIAPNAYLWQYADVLTDLPVAGSDYTYTDAEIPFLTIALSGQIPYYVEYTNFQANTREFFLHLVEQGARPSFLLTWEDPIELQNSNSASIYSSRYELYKGMIVEWYSDLAQLFEAVGTDGMIIGHERMGDLAKVTWDNGTIVYLNFGDKAGDIEGVTLEKLSFKVVNGNGI
jgi:hypothetical protein